MSGLNIKPSESIWEYRKSFKEDDYSGEQNSKLNNEVLNGLSADEAGERKLGQTSTHMSTSESKIAEATTTTLELPQTVDQSKVKGPSPGVSATSLLSEKQGSTISFHNISYSVDVPVRCGCGRKEKKHILKEIR